MGQKTQTEHRQSKQRNIVALVRRYRQGEKEVFSEIFDFYCDYLYRFLYIYTNNSPYIEDILQETFIRIAMHLDTLKNDERINEWVFSICRNTAINFEKKERMYLRRNELDLPSPEDISPDEYILREEREQIVREALQRLTKEQRAVILLSRYEGMRYSEIGNVLNKSENAVKSLVHRAMTRLGELLERNNGL